MKKIYIISLLCCIHTVQSKEIKKVSHLLGGDGAQPYCGTVAPGYRDACCKELLNKLLYTKWNLSDINKKNQKVCATVINDFKKSVLRLSNKWRKPH